MEHRKTAPICERGSDLIGFLYDEVDSRDAQAFEAHLGSCQQCQKDLTSFKQIRESISSWKHEALGVIPASATLAEDKSAVFRDGFEPRKRSAVAALKGFFDLSPLWMKGAVAFACVVFCVAMVWAAMRIFQSQPNVALDQKSYTEAELKLEIERALAQERALQTARNDESSARPTGTEGQIKPKRKASTGVGVVAGNKVKQRPLTKSEREQLAADLRLISPDDDPDFGLLGDRINR